MGFADGEGSNSRDDTDGQLHNMETLYTRALGICQELLTQLPPLALTRQFSCRKLSFSFGNDDGDVVNK